MGSISARADNDLKVEIKRIDSAPKHRCPDITSYEIVIYLENTTIGAIKAQLLNRSEMARDTINEMWEQCRAFDDTCPEANAKLGDVENFISNECFLPEKQELMDLAEWILVIEEVYLERKYRRRGLSLVAVDALIQTLSGGDKCVVLLQAGPICRYTEDGPDGDTKSLCILDIMEKLARHWKRMGFDEWSYTDDAWLCLSTSIGERPDIQEIIPAFFEAGGLCFATLVSDGIPRTGS